MNLSKKSKIGKNKFLFFILLSLFIPQIINADNSHDIPTTTAETLSVMPEVYVEAARIAPTTGMTIIDKEMIENLPTRNGSVNEIIGIVPGVQYSEGSINSLTAGEITPPVVSISGSRFYDNNYTIDGISNNSPLDPVFESISTAYKLPGHPQIHFLRPEIIEQITVYNSNIPAEFGGFTGGQIDTQTISPTTDFWGKIHYRTTSDNWTKFHINSKDQEDFNNSNNSNMQPSFKKHDYGLTLNTPIGIDTSLITSYQQLYSQIPLQHIDGITTQKRRHETFFTKLGHYFSNDFNISLSALYSSTSSEYFTKDYKDSNYAIDGKNYSLITQAENIFSKSKLNLTLSYTSQKTERKAPENRFSWSPETDSIDWSTGKEGGYGVLETGQDQLSIKSELTFDTIPLGQANHIFKLGGELTYSNQYYYRPKTNYSYYYDTRFPVKVPTSCTPNNPACIANEQYLYKRTKYKQTDTDAEIIDVATFLQDSMVWKRLEIIPGVRISYDDFTSNVNIAPRFAASLDVFGNQMTILFVGKNRYYSGTLLTNALYQGIEVINQEWVDEDRKWKDNTPRSTTFRYQTNDVKTPYSDELTLGLIQKVLGGELKFQYIEKKNKDEFSRQIIRDTAKPRTEPDIYLMNNLGRSGHESYQISWQRSWSNHFFELNTTWQKTTTSHDDYFDPLDEEDIVKTIWYKGEELHYYEIPREDFNRPVIANFIYTCNLPYNLTFTNTTKYRGAYWKLNKTGETRPSNINPEQPDPRVYERVKSDSSVVFDWGFIWKAPKNTTTNITFSLDIYNVFNRKAKISYETNPDNYEYELGRQVWAGLELNF